jgi:uncharacterized protein
MAVAVVDPEAERMAVAFARILRGAGLAVPLDTVLSFASALSNLGLTSRDRAYWAGRATLVRRPEDIAIFDRAFRIFWERQRVLLDLEQEAPPQTITITVDSEEEGTDDDTRDAEPDEGPTIHLRFSAAETLRQKDFSTYTDEERDEAYRLMSQLRFSGSMRRSRRLVQSKRRRGRPDIRRTVRAALRAGGEPIDRKYLEQGERARRLVLVLDISGSMESYARALLRFVHAASVGRQKVEIFTLGTRLTRVSREMSSRDPDKALERAASSVQDWSGGTRLGEGMKAFNDEWGIRGMARGSIVVILSDGWDRGDPDVLAEQMARLHRVAFRVVWVNPLKVTPGYAPLARGMAAALPHVDEFIEGHSVEAMEDLARIVSR